MQCVLYMNATIIAFRANLKIHKINEQGINLSSRVVTDRTQSPYLWLFHVLLNRF